MLQICAFSTPVKTHCSYATCRCCCRQYWHVSDASHVCQPLHLLSAAKGRTLGQLTAPPRLPPRQRHSLHPWPSTARSC